MTLKSIRGDFKLFKKLYELPDLPGVDCSSLFHVDLLVQCECRPFRGASERAAKVGESRFAAAAHSIYMLNVRQIKCARRLKRRAPNIYVSKPIFTMM